MLRVYKERLCLLIISIHIHIVLTLIYIYIGVACVCFECSLFALILMKYPWGAESVLRKNVYIYIGNGLTDGWMDCSHTPLEG